MSLKGKTAEGINAKIIELTKTRKRKKERGQ